MKLIYWLCLVFFISINAFAQNERIISGGNASSGMICASGKIYTWGANNIVSGTSTLYTGILGVGSTANYVSLPMPVQGTAAFNALTFKQLSPGTGTHYLALACNGSVWAWGSNSYGQIGNNFSGGSVAAPTQVKAGILTGTSFDDGAGFLTGVKIVHGGNNNSFAILTDGRLVAWGSNSVGGTGQLGDGTQVDKLTPVFVLDGSTNLPLQNVIQVGASDYACYALVDPDHDGLGTVYSWGDGLNGTLGRNANGTPGNPGTNSTGNGVSTKAYPVRFTSGLPLDGIKAISAIDVGGMALDTKGNVWCWGNGGWNALTGQGITVTHADPRRVVKGAATGQGTDVTNTYLRAKSISGGQGFAMAVTYDGKPVAWGNNGGCTAGGSLGNGTSMNPSFDNLGPSYILNSNGQVDSDVIAVYRGDTWGYYVNNKNKIFTWGCNDKGQLGIGSTTNVLIALPFTVPCEIKDPRPFATFSTRDTSACNAKLATMPLVLRTGFSLVDSIAARYQVQWFKNGLSVKGPSPASNPTSSFYEVVSSGNYKVHILYQGTKGDCGGTASATDSISVTEVGPTYSLPPSFTYSGDTLRPSVQTELTSSSYTWYSAPTGGNPLDTSIGAKKAAIAKAWVNADANGRGTLYVQQHASYNDTLFTKNQSCDPSFKSLIQLFNNYKTDFNAQTLYKASKPLILQKVKVKVNAKMGSTGTVTGTLQFGVFGTKSDYSGNPIPDVTKVMGTFSYLFSITRAVGDTTTNQVREFVIPINVQIPGNQEGRMFYLSPAQMALTNLMGEGTTGIISLGYANCTQPVPVNPGPNPALTQIGSAFVNNFSIPSTGGHFYDLVYEVQDLDCGRTPISFEPGIVTEIDGDQVHTTGKGLVLVPNPAKGLFHLVANGPGSVRILSMQGAEVARYNVAQGSNELSIEALPKGAYLVELTEASIPKRAKLLVE